MRNGKEEWRTIPSFPDYEASNYGRIRRKTKTKPGIGGGASRPGRLLKPVLGRGWQYVNLGGVCTKKICVLVAEAFLGIKPNGYDVHHIDRKKTNDAAYNLKYLSHVDHGQIHAREKQSGFQYILPWGMENY